MGKRISGKDAVGVVVRDFPEPDAKAIGQRAGMSQTSFAFLIGVKPKTLPNWEQCRVRPAGPALLNQATSAGSPTYLPARPFLLRVELRP